jgi:hypothetical protein
MNLFRPEEHACKWVKFNPEFETPGTEPVAARRTLPRLSEESPSQVLAA